MDRGVTGRHVEEIVERRADTATYRQHAGQQSLVRADGAVVLVEERRQCHVADTPGKHEPMLTGGYRDAAGGCGRGAGRLDGCHLRADKRGRAIRLLLRAGSEQSIAQFFAPGLAHIEKRVHHLPGTQPTRHNVRLGLHINSSPAARGCSRRLQVHFTIMVQPTGYSPLSFWPIASIGAARNPSLSF
ncbi:hypothetical protein [Sphingomonas sp. 2378]|uniref:hypothetical protein n=1 Tax=Sphingomonas sp. 2378 TaxID=1219748 RepID=UPI00311B4000